MSKLYHRIFVFVLVLITLVISLYLILKGYDYYGTPLHERFYHSDHKSLKPNGFFGHGYGIIGTLLITIGVVGYMARKRMRSLARFGALKYWLEVHIFLCVLGSILITFHTAFKLGGIVSISFWSMVAVVASGVIGRYIYLQIPRTIQGRELSLNEIKEMGSDFQSKIENVNIDKKIKLNSILSEFSTSSITNNLFGQFFSNSGYFKTIKKKLTESDFTKNEIKEIIKNLKKEISLNTKIQRLEQMQKLFRYWHIAHLPFALIMLIIMIIHVGVALALGYKWIF